MLTIADGEGCLVPKLKKCVELLRAACIVKGI